jgi:hypothetical protein
MIFSEIKREVSSVPSFNLFYNSLPPPVSGKQIILAIHQLKLDPFLV